MRPALCYRIGMSTFRTRLGARGEELAARFLEAQGYTVRERNYHCRYGEIDLICAHGEQVVFCEVKLRRSDAYGTPEEAVTERKLGRLARTAQTYLAEREAEDADWRIDVVAIEVDRRGAVVRTALYQGVGG